MKQLSFVMAGGGTGGHVIPAIAVARELVARGHRVAFIGTPTGMEAKLVPQAGFPIEWIQIGGLNRVGLRQLIQSLLQLPISILKSVHLLRQLDASAIFSMGGYVAGPVMLAAKLLGRPIVLMEPNAIPGFTARRGSWMVSRALVNFDETAKMFPGGKAEAIGLPVRSEFLEIQPKTATDEFCVLVTGGSQGSRALNQAVRAAWPLVKQRSWRFIHQTGKRDFQAIRQDFESSGVRGEVVEFIADMPARFAEADLVVCRSGAGATAELAASGKPSLLIPLPTAADDHQRHNAEAMERAGAAKVLLEQDLSAERLVREIEQLANAPSHLTLMQAAARRLSKPNAAARAATVLEDAALAH